MKLEETLHKLERIVQELEAGNISLDKAIKIYQEGMLLSRQCLDLLDKAEKKIQICSKDKSGNVKIKPFKEKDYAGENK
ncbi:MAG: exodeoxyribonuclease VII small subunit [Candidatus Omnitrophica bacterium]|nr:exodeoxyribonuclease VII small subunit [Candidatus Omnitrophota bacterium]MDD5351580.1 exodeoxyribonuclease VII small subunit [Candidatus Omnitrophota bacterium]MDD5551015.1 exodeoxyribonuclease VII small subunit [Candidatus Omnitrophota bacterium]